MMDVQRADGTVTIVVSGDIDLSNADTFEDRLDGEIDSRVTDVTLDLSQVEYLDSAGVRVMFTLAARLETRQIELHLVIPPGSRARRILEIAGFPVPSAD